MKKSEYVDASSDPEIRIAADNLQKAAVAHALVIDSKGHGEPTEEELGMAKLAGEQLAIASLAFGRAVIRFAKEMKSS